jgi:hypothetical protein
VVGISNQGVHGTHCCPVHGCKYGSEDCPIKLGQMTPFFEDNNGCQACEDSVQMGDTPAGTQPEPRDVDEIADQVRRDADGFSALGMVLAIILGAVVGVKASEGALNSDFPVWARVALLIVTALCALTLVGASKVFVRAVRHKR